MPDFSPSILIQSPAIIGVFATLVIAITCAVIGSVIAGRSHHDAGVFAAGIGLATLSVRGGSIGTILRSASGSGVFGVFLVELLLLAAVIFLIWAVLHRLQGSGLLHDDSVEDIQDPPVELLKPTLRDKLCALGVQTIITLVLVLLLAQLDAKKQILTLLFIASFLGSVGAHHLFPIRGGIWFWSGPLIAGFIAYTSALVIPDPSLSLGVPPNPLANVLPLDYAGIGVSGALFGYWASRRWHRERAALAQSLEAAENVAG